MAGREDSSPVSSGVDALIERLRSQGVEAGRAEAERILAEARTEARRIVDRANAEARERRQKARQEADAFRLAGEEALKTAVRDTVLSMKTGLMANFRADVQRLISHAMSDPELLRQMIVEVAGRVRDGAGVGAGDRVEIVLPAEVVGLEELRNDPEELESGRLTQFVFGLTGEMLREGVTFATSDELSAGIRVRVTDKDVTLDLTDRAVAELLLQHLQPRFRAILEGVVR